MDKTSHDFGNVTASSNRTVDFQIVNQYQFSIILSTFSFDTELSTAFTPTTVEPGDTLIYRVRINPKKKGLFDKTFPISFFHLSDTVYFNVRANVLTTDFKDKSLVKRFAEKPGKNDGNFKDFDAKFKVIDAETRKPVSGASITIVSKSPSYKNLETDKNGRVMRVLHNRYDVSIYAFGYETAKVGISLGCDDSIRTVALAKRDPNSKTEFEYMYEYEGANPITIKDTLANLDPLDEKQLLEPLEKGNYKANNIVFLMDVSISMKDHERMDLLKASIIQLVELMRPEDNVSVITFSEHTRTLVVPTYLTNDNRADVIRLIKTLKPGGLTNGGRGLKMAYKLIRENYDPTKNNQVVLATDGALGSYMKHEDMVKLVQKNAIYARTSVVTLRGYNWSGKYMREIVKAGNGKLLPVNNEAEAKLMLIREIKTNSNIGLNE